MTVSEENTPDQAYSDVVMHAKVVTAEEGMKLADEVLNGYFCKKLKALNENDRAFVLSILHKVEVCARHTRE